MAEQKGGKSQEGAEAKSADMSDYEPLGVWTLPWGRIFPWLVTGHDNRLPADDVFLDQIRLKTLHQDFLSLASLYRRIGGASPNLTIANVKMDFLAIANEFSNGVSLLNEALAKPDANKPDNIKSLIELLHCRLGQRTKANLQDMGGKCRAS